MKISKDKVVSLSYKLEVEGEVIDQSQSDKPLSYLHGHNNIIVGLEKFLDGKDKGDSFEVAVDPEEGYGTHDPENLMVLDKKDFESEIEIGVTYFAQTQDGDMVPFTIVALEDDKVTADFNHELAGVILNFSGEIVDVRDATEEELARGFVANEEYLADLEEDED